MLQRRFAACPHWGATLIFTWLTQMRRILASSFGLLAAIAISTAARADGERVLPVNDRVREMTLAFCLTGDAEGATGLLAKRLLVSGGFGHSDAEEQARALVASGFCADYLSTAEAVMPGVTAHAAAALRDSGFTTRTPLTLQAAGRRGGFFSTLNAAFAAVGTELRRAYPAARVGRLLRFRGLAHTICDESWARRVNDLGYGFAPSPVITRLGA